MPISYLPNGGGVILAWLSIIAAVSIIIYNPAARYKKIETAKKIEKKNGFHDVVV